MATLKLIICVALLATTTVSEKVDEANNTNVKIEIPSPAIASHQKIKADTLEIIRKSLHRSNKDTCGVPHPKCTTECLGEIRCVCHQRKMGSYSYYIYPCRGNSKICKAGEYKLFDYSKINPLHSVSLPVNPTSNKIRQGVTDDEKQQILETHNNLRATIARGEESRSPQEGVYQPSGSNINELVWNEELAYIAQKWADQCNFAHEVEFSRRSPCSRPYDAVGQNIYKSDRSWVYSVNQWPGAIKAWYDEVAGSPVSIVNKYASGVTSKMIGHYTQLVWAETYEVGCGAVYHKGGMYEHGSTTLYVCNYGPAGNMIGSEMYKIGKPSTECGKSGKSTKYPELCATTL